MLESVYSVAAEVAISNSVTPTFTGMKFTLKTDIIVFKGVRS